ncbi:MAG: Dbl homology domain-containing protein, partial [Piptocephalis tieghemiana]
MRFQVRRDATPEDLQVIFGNTPHLLPFHEDLVHAIEERWSEWDELQCLGDLFTSRIKVFESYIAYLKNYPLALARLDRLNRQSTTFRKALSSCGGGEDDRANILAYLILPIPRVPRYRKFLEDLLRLTPPTHPDHSDLRDAAMVMSRIAQEVVETIRETENQQRILDIQAALVGFHGNLVTPGRRYVHHGTLTKVSRSGSNESRVCFLFDDLLVWCKPSSKGQYLYRGKINLRRCEV